MNKNCKVIPLDPGKDATVQGLSIDTAATVQQFIVANPVVSIGLAGAAAYLLYVVFFKNK